MITKITTEEELVEIFVETFFNKQDKVTKVAKHSVMSGIAEGIAKVAQKAIKDIANVEANIFPDSAFGDKLDKIASNYGISDRFEATNGTTFLRVVGDAGTTYNTGVHTFTGNHGVVFNLVNDFTIDVNGYGYIEVVSAESGSSANVSPLTINKVSPTPSGHKYVINEYKVNGGRDEEQDEFFRQRIKDTPNINAQKTIAYIEQILMSINSNILKVFNYGTKNGKTILAIATQNGSTLTQNQLDTLFIGLQNYIAITDLKPFGQTFYGVKLQNIEYQNVDIDFRVKLSDSTSIDDYRLKSQLIIQKKFDYRYWKDGDQVRWDNIFGGVKSISGAEYIPRQYFFINGNTVDLSLSIIKLPRLRSFMMRDENGNILANQSGTLQPYFYPSAKNIAITSSII